MSPEAPPNRGSDSSPGSTDAPLEPSDVSLVDRDTLVDAIQKLRVSLDSSMYTIKARIDLIEAALHHVKELLIHVQPPSAFQKPVYHRGLTYREEQSLARMYQSLEEWGAKLESQPTTRVVGRWPDTLDPKRKSTP